MEALANYSALLYLEKRKGPKALEAVLADYRKRLLAQAAEGRTLESMGPIIWGLRLASSMAPDAWRTITYEKGSWVIHMLRGRLGDQRFLALLGEILKRYRQSTLTTAEFRALAEQFSPPGSPDPKLETFFENWVYSTGIPALKLSFAVQGKAPALKLNITVQQSGVDDSFSAFVPVEVQVRGAKPATYWLRTDSEPVTITVPMKQAPLAVVLDPAGSVLAVKR
jgi:aminopeptidase N